ncbi:hypothetical protein IGJ28_003328 [Enterococcus sp. AZ091]|uniref:hypothetical protein n=1 Tax=Enterococcus sp. AZ091 TaxID=2774720 RepID=UPI003F260D42
MKKNQKNKNKQEAAIQIQNKKQSQSRKQIDLLTDLLKTTKKIPANIVQKFKDENAAQSKTFKYKLKYLAPTLISIVISLVTLNMNRNYSESLLPLNYSITKTEDIPKYYPDLNDNIFFSLSAFVHYKLHKNTGGTLTNMFLLTLDRNEKVRVHTQQSISVTPDNLDTLYQKYQNTPTLSLKIEDLDYDSSSKLLWNTSHNSVYIFYPKIHAGATRDSISTAFLVLKGNNNNTQILTLLQKIGTKEENHTDTLISFTDLQIYDIDFWEKSLSDKPEKTKQLFLNIHEATIKKYQKIVQFLKETNSTF